MIGGMPNVGKSTIINKLRQQAPKIKGKYITKTSKTPAETRHLSGFRVSIEPNSWLVDTPGLMLPSLQTPELGIKLGIIGCINDKIIGRQVLVEQLFEMIKRYGQIDNLVKHYSLRGVPLNVDEVIDQIRTKKLHPDLERTCQVILDDYREGKLGKMTLDEVELS